MPTSLLSAGELAPDAAVAAAPSLTDAAASKRSARRTKKCSLHVEVS